MHDLTLTQGAFSDAELVVRSRHGDDAAYEILADRHRPALHRAIHALGASPDLSVVALDATHAALRRQAGPTQGVRPFLLLVLRDLVLREGDSPCPVRPGAVQPFVDHITAAHSSVAAAVASLPDVRQALLWHRYVDDDPDLMTAALLDLAPREVEPLAWETALSLRTTVLRRRLGDESLSTPCRAYLLRLDRGRALAVPGAVRHHAASCRPCGEVVADLDAIEHNLGGLLAGHLLGEGAGAYLGASRGFAPTG